MADISGYGTNIQLVSTTTYPNGLSITQFADDADPIDVGTIALAETGMGLNGDMVKWSKATPIKVTINVLADSQNDRDLNILANSVRVQKGSTRSCEKINMTVLYPECCESTGIQNSDEYRNGYLLEAMVGKSITSAGRFKSRSYTFVFESKS
jgi:hypothetical protein